MSLKIFISYAKEDRAQALIYFNRLSEEGFHPWIDINKLLPGQNWEAEIERAFSDANVVILLLSKNSVSKRGFVQREANDAIERLRYKHPTDIYVIPLLLDQCEVPSHIAGRLQYLDVNTPGAWEQVLTSLKIAAKQQSIEIINGLPIGPFRVFTERFEEQWRGAPGHDISIEYPRFESAQQLEIAKELSQFFSGVAVKVLINSRQKPWVQSPELFQNIDELPIMNSRWDSFVIVHATKDLLSLSYDIGWFDVGAAHPNSYVETYNFLLVERLQALTLPDFFVEGDEAVKRISTLCIDALCREYWRRVGEKPDEEQMKWFKNGAGENFENFSAFTVSHDHFTFLFSPYQVGCYALGRWSVDISFYDLLGVLRSDGPHKYSAELT
ncbi:TIR domain-containing protein [Aeromonas caviae]|uniref:TIR domain-containing protein n=1 Tax=Aeromonas caviae TaxID=648 RepID=UPI0029D51E02|nr:TIR domain-containing protein [Aeromonas caviae]MDX7764100.1 TIR domain-containing protein [Aeromonas caviae]